MGASVRPEAHMLPAMVSTAQRAPEPDPLDELMAMKAQEKPAEPDPLDDLMAMKPKAASAAGPEDQRNLASTPAPTPKAPLLTRIASHVGNIASGIPGVERAGAYMGSKIGGIPYQEALRRIRDQEKTISPGLRTIERMAGATPLAMVLPGSAAVSGATLGAADQALSADEMSAGERVGRTAVGAGVGGLVGKAMSLGGTAIKGKMAPEPTANLVARDVARSNAAGPKYDTFRSMGDLGSTKQLDDILKLPIVRTAVNTVKSESPTLAKLPDTDAQVLDAAYKRVGSKAFSALHGFEPGEARAEFLDAINNAANAKGGSYRAPVETFAEHSQGMESVQRGRDALDNSLSRSGGGQKAALTKSPAALQKDFGSMYSADQQAVLQGLYGQLGRRGSVSAGRIFGTKILPRPSPALLKADVIRQSIDPSTTAKLGVAALTSNPFLP